MEKLRAAIDAGKIGTPALGTAVILGWRDAPYYRSDPWRGKWCEEGGGVMVNQAPHQLAADDSENDFDGRLVKRRAG